MIKIGRELRPMLDGSWRTPPANGRRSFTLGGFAIGLLATTALLVPALGLLLDGDPAYANPSAGRRKPQPPATAIADDARAEPVAPPTGVSAPLPAGPSPAETPPTGAGRVAARRRYTVQMRVTAYCPCRTCCGTFSDGKTASGKTIWDNDGRFVAGPRWLPFGATVKVPGYHGGMAVPVYDRGRAIRGYRLDVFFFSHAQARAWGTQVLDVEILLPGPGD